MPCVHAAAPPTPALTFWLTLGRPLGLGLNSRHVRFKAFQTGNSVAHRRLLRGTLPAFLHVTATRHLRGLGDPLTSSQNAN
jgi:hypothetical protein